MDVRKGFVDLVGNTPLVRLNKVSDATGCEILGKCEFMNPGGSVKDRAALAIILDAEEKGLLRPGGTIVEGTAGNTGIGLALVGNARGYKTVIVIPETQSQEKMDMLRLVGADLRPVPAVPYKDPNNYVKLSGRLAEELARTLPNGAIWANQFDNVANRVGHYRTTGPEIWAQTGGKARRLHLRRRHRRHAGRRRPVPEGAQARRCGSWLADPMGAALYNWYAHGELKAEGSSISEGIGQGRVTANLEGAPVDEAFQITDAEALPYIFDLVVEEGLVLGQLLGDQHRRCGARGAADGAGAHDRDHPRRLRHPLSEQAVQPGIPAREGPAGPGLARLSPAPTRASAHARSPGQHRMAGRPIWTPPTCGWWTPPGSCRGRSAAPEPSTRRRTSRAPCSSTWTRSASPRDCTRTWCRRRPSSARGCASWGSATASRIVVYDDNRFFASARVWWLFRFMGHDDVMVLDGGLAKWRSEERPLTDKPSRPQERHFTVRQNNLIHRELDQMRANLTSRREQVVDARSAGRFHAREPEPRAGLRSGHIPGARSLHYAGLVQATAR